MIFNADKEDRREKLSNALKENLKKRKTVLFNPLLWTFIIENIMSMLVVLEDL